MVWELSRYIRRERETFTALFVTLRAVCRHKARPQVPRSRLAVPIVRFAHAIPCDKRLYVPMLARQFSLLLPSGRRRSLSDKEFASTGMYVDMTCIYTLVFGHPVELTRNRVTGSVLLPTGRM